MLELLLRKGSSGRIQVQTTLVSDEPSCKAPESEPVGPFGPNVRAATEDGYSIGIIQLFIRIIPHKEKCCEAKDAIRLMFKTVGVVELTKLFATLNSLQLFLKGGKMSGYHHCGSVMLCGFFSLVGTGRQRKGQIQLDSKLKKPLFVDSVNKHDINVVNASLFNINSFVLQRE
ncbi:uncharacterized protein V6R79_017229 [Siganus canaliculatus]